jgi:hypothetical protein
VLSTASPKPARGSLRAERKAKKNARESYEDAEKAAVRKRDGDVCRWPSCGSRDGIQTAHLQDKGMGGDHGNRTHRTTMIRLCFDHHLGPESLHSKDLRIEPLTERGTDGPVLFLRADEQRGWCVVHAEDGR